MNPKKLLVIFSFSFFLPSAISAAAAENQSSPPAAAGGPVAEQIAGEAAAEVTTLPPVTVLGQPEDSLTGVNSFDRQILERLPARNDSINESIRILPGIQLGELHRTSDNAGEILPPSLSISGGRFYQNNFTLDGVSNNSLLDPANDDRVHIDDVPGHPQELFVDPSLLEGVRVYRSNIPARYGSFTGGVVDSETRDPAVVFRGQLGLRHTRSAWTELHKADDRREEYATPRDGSTQPEFRKYDGEATFDLPVTENLGLLVNYSKIYSRIPLVPFDETRVQKRSLENFFIKGVLEVSPDTKWSVSGAYTPYSADLFLSETKTSDYVLENSAYFLMSSLEQRLPFGHLTFHLSYKQSENSRQAPADYYNWRASENKPWGFITDAGNSNQYSKEGGFGDLEKEQRTWSADIHMELDAIETASLQHQINWGANFQKVSGRFVRHEETTRYTVSTRNEDVVCSPGAVDCISQDQFMWFKTVYPEDDTEARILFYDAYVENLITWGRFSLRPGLRFSYDDLQSNANLAHRLAAGYDLFGNGRTMLLAGHNRYYGKTFLTHALNENRRPSQNWSRSLVLQADNSPEAWQLKPASTVSATRLADLDTPYSDEISIGLKQRLWGGLLNLTYLEREGRDELALTVLEKDPETGYKYSEWTNDGRSQHKEASLMWERNWGRHSLMVAATWQETETSNSNYRQRADFPDQNDDDLMDPVWYQGDLVDREDLPRPNFNRDFVGTLIYSGRIYRNFTFTNVTRYRSGYEALADTGENITLATGRVYDVFAEIEQPESWIFDWRLDWRQAIARDQHLVVSLEINNMFNKKVASGERVDNFDLGRQFWLGLTYSF